MVTRRQQALGYLEGMEGVLDSQNVSQFRRVRTSLVWFISGVFMADKVRVNRLAVENSRIFAGFHAIITADSNPAPFVAQEDFEVCNLAFQYFLDSCSWLSDQIH